MSRVVKALQLIASELVSNAITHGAGEIELCVAVHDRQARLEVSDEAVDCEAVLSWRDERPSQPYPTGGRGLGIVEAYSDRWGCNLDGDTKTVWAEIDLTG